LIQRIVLTDSLVNPEDKAAIEKWSKAGYLRADFPVVTRAVELEKRYRTLRESVLALMSSNAVLRNNVIIWDLSQELMTPEARTSLGIALTSRAVMLLPMRWRQTWRIRWEEPKPKNPEGTGKWIYSYPTVVKLGNTVKYSRRDAELPKTDDIVA